MLNLAELRAPVSASDSSDKPRRNVDVPCKKEMFFEWSPRTDFRPGTYSGMQYIVSIFSGVLSGVSILSFHWHSIWQPVWHFIICIHTHIHTYIHIYIYVFHLTLAVRCGSAHWDLELAVEVRQCPLSSCARGWGPAVPTEIWSSRLRRSRRRKWRTRRWRRTWAACSSDKI